ncbi:MAG TPA: hypothetical protein VL346_02070 [Acidobacteriaceae bacterium]|nr:hypothetical protein [Acidobacteriaceae bacterium]
MSATLAAWGQAREHTASTQQNPTESAEAQKVPLVPGLSTRWRGFNAGLSFSQVHDSSAGWYNLFTPAVSYSFSRHYSADASISIYPYRLVQTVISAGPDGEVVTGLVADHGDVSDLVAGVHATFWKGDWRTTATALATAPTGNHDVGLGAGKVTFDLSDRVDRYFDRGSLMADLGGGDTSGLFNRQVTKDQTSVGKVVHFAVGGVLYLPWSWYWQSMAYELLPIGQQTVYTAVGPPGSPSPPVYMGTGISEENGFTTTLGVPLNSHFTLWSYYDRSLRQQTDTVSTGITYVWRPVVTRKRLSMIDRALREAEKNTP